VASSIISLTIVSYRKFVAKNRLLTVYWLKNKLILWFAQTGYVKLTSAIGTSIATPVWVQAAAFENLHFLKM
jgi:hypothetical protein